MADNVVIYTVVHQPRRLCLPASRIPPGLGPEEVDRYIFDEAMNQRYFSKVSQRCYYPATEMFSRLAARGFKLSIGFSLSFIRQCQAWDERLLDKFRQLVASPNVELIGVEPYHSFLFYLDIQRFQRQMQRMRAEMKDLFGVEPEVTDTTEMFMSNDLYYALNQLGFRGAFMDGRPWVMQGREPNRIYRYRDGISLLVRHYHLSDDVGYRFSDRTWPLYPLRASTYAYWLRRMPGDLVVLGWDYETFGEHHAEDTGIFRFMEHLAGEIHRLGLATRTASEAVQLLGRGGHQLQLPETACTWAGGVGDTRFFLGNKAQWRIFQLMHHAYNKALLTGDERIIDLAAWLTQSDNLHLIQWYGSSGSEAEVSAYFTPGEWWQLGPDGIVDELAGVYREFIRWLDSKVPAAASSEKAGAVAAEGVLPGRGVNSGT